MDLVITISPLPLLILCCMMSSTRLSSYDSSTLEHHDTNVELVAANKSNSSVYKTTNSNVSSKFINGIATYSYSYTELTCSQWSGKGGPTGPSKFIEEARPL